MESFTQQPPVAVVAAGNHALATKPDQERFSLQVQQRRFGLWLNEKGAVRGQVELGFVDFAKATPTVQALPRLRIERAEEPRGRERAGHRAHLREHWGRRGR
ncbi:hypothetical protein [Myxococcus xanthus]|uniref:Uncharacterized protein n=1 Tax=Myxococcus xanthus TaxID=34 RepID=A0AAE6G5M0_MYXXA|nr:hypothetical protein [Myxococcus xanthus]QDE71160.1 hypothetical protein BHS09_31630 [Myxococcus xanthus]QDE78440.1 hypothetical protein BHS08_31650 [Myxococcus xanthus]QDE85818.1 hypothetical protein BHS07_32205 [Myxococcus xanthus]QDF07740.1 hypothetical protein BHS04_31750 [Myxococcus xanthus]